jgi:hypothetical protein
MLGGPGETVQDHVEPLARRGRRVEPVVDRDEPVGIRAGEPRVNITGSVDARNVHRSADTPDDESYIR